MKFALIPPTPAALMPCFIITSFLRISGPGEIFKAARPPRVHAIMIISSAMFALAAFHASVGRGEEDGAALTATCFVL